MRRRLIVFRAVLVLAFSLILVRLIQLQVAEGTHNRKLADENRIRIVRRLAPRGTIYDRRGRVLASSRLSLSIRAVPREVRVAGESDAAQGLARVLGVPAEDIRTALAEPGHGPYDPVVLWRDASDEVVARYEEHAVYLSGLSVVADAVRLYPHGSLAAHVLGYVREIGPDDLARLENAGYRPRDLIGKAGVEKTEETALRGVDGGDQIEVDARGRRVRTLGTVSPEPGSDVWLTLDLDVQQAAEEALGDRAGAVVALDPWTGDVLALASHPAYDLNLFSGALSPEDWRALRGPDRPLQNRATSSRYEPGSIFKIVTAAAALESGASTIRDRFYCSGVFTLGGWRMRCWKREGHGSVDSLQGFAQSCNVMFATLGRRVGADALATMARRLGLGAVTGIDLPDEAAGLVPSPSWKRETRGKPWYPGDTAQMAIGQGDTLVTPLQLAREAAAVANSGYLVTPRLVTRVGEGEEMPPAGEARSVGLTQETIAALRAGMEGVIAEGGTAHRIAAEQYGIAGKTGTAQNPGGEPHAWFAGYAPHNDPRIAIAVLVEHGRSGSAVAAPIARHVLDAMLLPPAERTPWPAAAPVTLAAGANAGHP